MTSLLAPTSSSSNASATMQDELPEAEPAAWQGQRIVAVSNRLVFPGQTHAGGLAQALHGLFSRFPGAWLGWSGRTVECDRPATSVHSICGTRYVTIDLQETLFRQYYMQFSNRVLWPLLHSRSDLINYDGDAYTGYMAVNDRFGAALADLVHDDDLVWVHDYHLLPLASLARRRGLGNKL